MMQRIIPSMMLLVLFLVQQAVAREESGQRIIPVMGAGKVIHHEPGADHSKLEADINEKMMLLHEERRRQQEESATRQILLRKGDSPVQPVSPHPLAWSESNIVAETGEWIFWGNGFFFNSFGFSGPIDWRIAQRFTPADLEGYENHSITQVNFWPADQGDFTIKVWYGDNPPVLAYSQEVNSFDLNQMNTVLLDQAVPIPLNQDLWFGYGLAANAGDQPIFPMGADSGPAQVGKGDMIQFSSGDEWVSLFQQFQIDVNWLLQAFVEPTADPAAPAAPAGLVVEAAQQGALEATISWENPSQTFGGDPLNEIDNVSLFRNGMLIHTVANPTPGGQESFLDSEIAGDGIQAYSVRAENAAGPGPFSMAEAFVGEDVPAAPPSVQLEMVEEGALISWEAPETGLNGGFINAQNTLYSLQRLPDGQILAEEIAGTSFNDFNLPGAGNYTYRVTASNQNGVGGSTSSNPAFFGPEGLLFFETFDYTPGGLPDGWTQQGVPHGWSVFESNDAGGEVPELRLNWVPSMTGTSRMVSSPIAVQGSQSLRLAFKHILYHFSNSVTVGVDVSFGSPSNWQSIWEVNVSGDLPQSEQTAYISVPPGANTMYIAFRFTGTSFDIQHWNIDDVLIEVNPDNDLAALSLSGPQFPVVGNNSMYSFTIKNVGNEAQDSYQLRLIKEDEEELAILPGNAIAPGETQTYELFWIPEEGHLGNQTLYGEIVFSGDESPANNLSAPLQVTVQPAGSEVVNIGDPNSNFYSSAPYDFFWDHSLSQTLYYSHEISIPGGVITGLHYEYQFNEGLFGKEIQIWLGETELDDLGNDWVDPASLQLVFDGQLDFPADENVVFIPLHHVYNYQGGNLVVYSSKTDDSWSSGKNFKGQVVNDGVTRTLKVQRDNTPFDPANPDPPNAFLFYPNIALYFSTAGFGGLEGTVTDGSGGLEGVEVKVLGTNISTQTGSSGFFQIPVILPGTYDVLFTRFAYADLLVEDVLVEEDETTSLSLQMELLPTFSVSGLVAGNDGVVVEGASVVMNGPDQYVTTTGEDGSFSFDEVFAGSYSLAIAAPGYEPFNDDSLQVDQDLDLDITLVQTLAPPIGLMVDVDNHGAGNAMMSWNTGTETEFRYDDGVPQNALAAQNTDLNSVLGAAHRRKALLVEMSWMMPDDPSTPISDEVKVWVFGLDDEGMPDASQVLYEQEGVGNVMGQWSSHTFSQPVYAPNGFLIGIATEETLSLVTDQGSDPDWPFVPETQFANFDVTSQEFLPLEGYGFEWNFFIRSTGIDFGPITDEVAQAGATSNATGFNVFLDEFETPLTFTEDTEFLFTGLDEGTYTAGVQSVYATGESEIVTIDFDIVFPAAVTLNVTTTTGQSPEGAVAVLTGIDNQGSFTYEGVAGSDGVIFFPEVKKGSYVLEVSLVNHNPFMDEAFVIDQDL